MSDKAQYAALAAHTPPPTEAALLRQELHRTHQALDLASEVCSRILSRATLLSRGQHTTDDRYIITGHEYALIEALFLTVRQTTRPAATPIRRGTERLYEETPDARD